MYMVIHQVLTQTQVAVYMQVNLDTQLTTKTSSQQFTHQMLIFNDAGTLQLVQYLGQMLILNQTYQHQLSTAKEDNALKIKSTSTDS